jgi:hypothetical protein
MMMLRPWHLLVALCTFLLLSSIWPAHSRAQAPGAVGWTNIHTARLGADFTDGGAVTTLQNIPGLTMVLPAGSAATYQFDCDLFYSQATVVADTFGFQFSVSPTNAQIGGIAATNATAYASGTPATITNTSATAVVAMTPAVTTVLYAHIGGAAEIPNNAIDTIVNVSVSQATAANVVVIKRGSVCRVSSMP